MVKAFEERNQSDSARRKLKMLAKVSDLDVEFVTALANFTWDYDPRSGREPLGWVSNTTLSSVAEDQLQSIAERLGLDCEFELSRDQAAKDLIQSHHDQSSDLLWANFCSAALNKNYGQVSEFASYFSLRGLNKTRVDLLHWNGSRIGMVEIAQQLFLKLFRGGSIERGDLAYSWCDLSIPLEYVGAQPSHSAEWLNQLLSAIESLPTKSGLSALINCCKGIVGGDKFFKQEVLQSLAYADVLRVNDLSVTEMFIAERSGEMSPHFYSNEWSFPLRFWSTNGGSVNRGPVPDIQTA